MSKVEEYIEEHAEEHAEEYTGENHHNLFYA